MYRFHLIMTLLVAASEAAQLPSNQYLPPGPSQGKPSFGQPGLGSQTGQGSFGQGIKGPGQTSGSSGQDTGNTRPQQETEKNAAVLTFDQSIDDNGYSFSYETSNGIKAEESGNAAQAQGSFSYQGDDGISYSIVYTSGEGGFQPSGAHLPTPPPTPEAILLALQQNAKDEAAGIFDDGKYHPENTPQSGGAKPSPPNSFGGGSSSAGGRPQFGSANHQGSFSPSAGYKY